jgi:phospholipase C
MSPNSTRATVGQARATLYIREPAVNYSLAGASVATAEPANRYGAAGAGAPVRDPARAYDAAPGLSAIQTRHRGKWLNQLFPLALAAVCLITPASAQISSFQHIILVIQENRTPDNLFQGLCTTPTACSTQPGPAQYNIQTTGWLDTTSPTGTTNPQATPFGLGYDLSHKHSAFVAMCDLDASGACAMDGAARVHCDPKGSPCPAARASYGYVDNSTGAVQPYLDLAKAYGWANYMFQTNQGPSYPAHQFLFGATSAPSADDDHNGVFLGACPSNAKIELLAQDIVPRSDSVYRV